MADGQIKRGFNVSSFKSQKVDLLRTNKFLLEFSMPPALRPGKTAFMGQEERDTTLRTLEYWSEAVSQPGMQIATNDGVRKYGWGPIQKRPYTTLYSDLQVTFYEQENALNWRYMKEWMKLINMSNLNIDENYISQGIKNKGVGESYPYELSYRNEYITDCRMYIFDHSGKRAAKTIVFREIYPISMPDVPLNWTDNNSLLKMNVTFTFLEWYEERQEVADQNLGKITK